MSAYYNEFDPKAAAWLRCLIERGLIAPGVVDERSIVDVRPDDLRGFTQCHFFAGIGGWSLALRLAGWPDDRPVWTGSPPCQPFSVAGKGLGRDDPRHLSPHFARLVGAARPAMLFGEQVADAKVLGKVAVEPKPGADGAPVWAWFDDLSDRLESAGYAIGASDLPAACIGAPHIRQRLYFGAVKVAVGDGDGQCERGEGSATARHGAPAESDCSTCRVANIERERSSPWIPATARRHEGIAEESGDGRDRQPRLRARRSVNDGVGVSGGVAGGIGHNSGCTGAPHEFWRNPDWLLCRDGRWRPVESGTFPLAHGVSARVGRLRGYGNAIVPPLAAEFIAAFDNAARDLAGAQ